MTKYLPGKTSDKQYHLGRKIGEGGFGSVYEAVDKTNQQKVAVKIYRNITIISPQDWETEALQAQSVSGSHIISTYGLHKIKVNGEEMGYLIMELAPDGNLRDILKNYINQDNGGFIPNSQLIDFMAQSLKGLGEVHQKLLHRDIKPENFLLLSKTIKISDFGLAKFIDESTRTKTYKGWGTYTYMAPESWILGEMSQSTDIYSMGVMFYELCTLQPPFISDNPIELEKMHRYGIIPSVRSINQDIPIGLEGVIKKAMSKDPRDRYQSVEKILSDLDSIKPEASSSSGMQSVLEIASSIYATEEDKKNKQTEEDTKNATLLSKCMFKIDEFVQEIQKVVDVFNQNFPQEKMLLSKGSNTNYTLIWKGQDLIRFVFNPHLSSMQLKIRGNELAAYGYAELVHGNEGEGINFILTGTDINNSYGEWKILEVTGSPLVPNRPHYSVAVEMGLVERISKLGNAMDVWQHQVKDITNLTEEITLLVNKSLEYLNNPPRQEKLNRMISEISDDGIPEDDIW